MRAFQILTSPVAQMVKHLPIIRETRVRSLDREDTLKKEVAIHSSTLAWKIPWTEEPGRLYSPQGRQDSDKTEQLHLTSNINPFDPHNISM